MLGQNEELIESGHPSEDWIKVRNDSVAIQVATANLITAAEKADK
mgnify:CR=1 FL=1